MPKPLRGQDDAQPAEMILLCLFPGSKTEAQRDDGSSGILSMGSSASL